jgi:hypothetical protein
MATTVEITPGPELDRAVAEAVGETVISREEAVAKCNDWRLRQPEPHGPDFESWFVGEWYLDGQPNSGGLDSLPSYSTDVHAAFAAAEKVGLFCGYNLGVRADVVTKEGWWVVGLTCDYSTDDDVLSRADTPALAICAAILKLKETSDGGV